MRPYPIKFEIPIALEVAITPKEVLVTMLILPRLLLCSYYESIGRIVGINMPHFTPAEILPTNSTHQESNDQMLLKFGSKRKWKICGLRLEVYILCTVSLYMWVFGTPRTLCFGLFCFNCWAKCVVDISFLQNNLSLFYFYIITVQ